MELLGKIKVLKLNQKVTESYTKSEVVITTDEQYPQHILIEFGGNKSDLLDPYKVGENVKVSINIRGREWTSPQGEIKYFNSIQGWRIERTSQEKPQPTNTPPANQEAPYPSYKEEDGDDLPF